MTAPLLISAPVDLVTVFDGSALITRKGHVPAFDDAGQADILIKGLPLTMDDSSIRASVTDSSGEKDTDAGERQAGKRIRFARRASWSVRNVSVEIDLIDSEAPLRNPWKKPDEAEIRRVISQCSLVQWQIEEVTRWLSSEPPAARDTDAKSIFPFSAWEAFIRVCEKKLSTLNKEEFALQSALKALEAQQREACRVSEPSGKKNGYCKNIHILLASSGETSEKPREVEVSYIVPGARWRPVYKLYAQGSGTRARIVLGALVAQKTGEDWHNAHLRFSAAELTRITQLPELPSRRIGREQTAKPPSFRKKEAPPASLFAGFDDWYRQLRKEQGTIRMKADEIIEASMKKLDELFQSSSIIRPRETLNDEQMMLAMSVPNAEAPLMKRGAGPPEPPPMIIPPIIEAIQPPPPSMLSDGLTLAGAFIADALPQAGTALPASMMSFRGPAAPSTGVIKADLLPTERKRWGETKKKAGREISCSDKTSQSIDDLCLSSPVIVEPEEISVQIPGNYLNYELAGPDAASPAARGTLVKARALCLSEHVKVREDEIAGRIRDAVNDAYIQTLEEMATPSFQCIYQAQGSAHVPDDGFPHRVDILSAETDTSVSYRTIPMIDPQVFGRLTIRNPFNIPLPAGQVQVFSGNAYMFTTSLNGTGEGGEAVFPMGVEQKIKVSRNTVFQQDEKGITGGNSVAHHTIEITVRSHMDRPVDIEVFERIPVKEDGEKRIDIRLSSSEPRSEAVEFIDDARVRGAQRWSIRPEPGEEKAVRLEYQLTIPSKMEIIGGNRRV